VKRNSTYALDLIPETGTTTVDNLYYWSYEQTVAMYVGENQDVIDAVTAALGEPTMVAQDGTPVEAPLETPVDSLMCVSALPAKPLNCKRHQFPLVSPAVT
jgi:hypothetical protein